jgi:hypothetical protein
MPSARLSSLLVGVAVSSRSTRSRIMVLRGDRG